MILFSPDDGGSGGGAETPEPDSPVDQGIPDTQSLIGGEAEPPAAPATSEPWINQEGTFKQGWYQRFPSEMQAPLARFKTVEDLAKGHAHAQSLIGKKGIFLPSEKSTPEEVSEFRKQIGVPERPEDYKIQPENVPAEQWSNDLAKPFQEIAHKHHVSQAALKELTAAYAKMEEFRSQHTLQSRNAEIIRKKTEGTATLKNLWHDQYGANIQRVKHVAANIMQVDENDPGFESAAMVAGIIRLASKLSEDTLVGSGGNGAGGPILTGEAAALDIIKNEDNALHKAYTDRFHPQHKDAVLAVRHHFKSNSAKRQ